MVLFFTVLSFEGSQWQYVTFAMRMIVNATIAPTTSTTLFYVPSWIDHISLLQGVDGRGVDFRHRLRGTRFHAFHPLLFECDCS